MQSLAINPRLHVAIHNIVHTSPKQVHGNPFRRKYIHTYIHTYRHTYRQTDRQTDIHLYIYIYIYTDLEPLGDRGRATNLDVGML